MSEKISMMVILNHEYSRTPAVLRAMSLAWKMNAQLHLYSFEYERSLAHAVREGFDLDAYLKGRCQKLDDFADALRAEGFDIETRVVWGHPLAERILSSVLALQPDYVVKDVHEETTIHRILYTPLDWQLLRECPAPLMLVREHTGNTPRRILAAVDPLDEHNRPMGLNDIIVKTSAALAMQCDAQVDVVHAFDYVPVLADAEGAAGWVVDSDIYDELRKLHKDALQDLGKKYGVPESQLHLLDGRPSAVLAEFARHHKIDLVVMGTIYRSRFERLAMGSTAESLLDRLDCDVLALKPEGFREQLTLLIESAANEAA